MYSSSPVLLKHLKENLPQSAGFAQANVYMLGVRLGGGPTGRVLARFAAGAWRRGLVPLFVMEGASLNRAAAKAFAVDCGSYPDASGRTGVYFLNAPEDTRALLSEAFKGVCRAWFVCSAPGACARGSAAGRAPQAKEA